MFCWVWDVGCCVCVVFWLPAFKGEAVGLGVGSALVKLVSVGSSCTAVRGVAAAGRGGNAFWKKARQKLLQGIAGLF